MTTYRFDVLTVDGAATLSSTLHAVGAVTFDSTLAVAGALTASGGVRTRVITLSNTLQYSYRAVGGSAISVLDSTIITLNTGQWAGKILLGDSNNGGEVAEFLVTGFGSGVTLVAQTAGARYSVTKDTPGKINVYYDGPSTSIKLQNKFGSTLAFVIYTWEIV